MGEAVFIHLGAAGIGCKAQGLDYAAWNNRARRALRPSRNGRGADVLVRTWLGWRSGVGMVPDLHSYVPGKGFGSYSLADDPPGGSVRARHY